MAKSSVEPQQNQISEKIDELNSDQRYFKGYDCIKNIPLYWGNGNRKPKSKLSKWASWVLDNWITQAYLMLLTLFALFGDDIRLLATEQSSDGYFFWTAFVCLVSFAVEIILSSISKEKYFNSFFFWLDILATISLILDIGWVWSFITGKNSNQDSEDVQESHVSLNRLQSITGPRNIRLMRIFRVIRLVRVAKIYKLAVERNLQKDETKSEKRVEIRFRGNEAPIIVEVWDQMPLNNEIDFDNLEDQSSHSLSSFSLGPFSQADHPSSDPASTGLNFDVPSNMIVIQNEAKNVEKKEKPKSDPEAKLGNRLTDVIMNRMIILVIGAVLVFPLFYPSLYLDDYKFFEFGLKAIYDVIFEHEEFEVAWNSYVDSYKDLNNPLIYLQVKNKKLWKGGACLDDLRLSEVLIYTIDGMSSDYYYWIVAVFDMKNTSKMEAWMSMLRTAFICVVIGVAALLLAKDTKEILLKPLEKTINRVQNMSNDPLLAIQLEEYESYTKNLKEKKACKSEPEEIKLLDNAINKIGSLLSIGFGEIGAEIITYNMKTNGGEINPLIAGRRCFCVFGVLCIKNLQELTSDLKEDTIQFINKISLITHSIASQYLGLAKKITGDKLSIVWKFPEECIELDIFSNAKKGLNDNLFVKELADMAVISFAKILAELKKSQFILNNGNGTEIRKIISEECSEIGIGLHQGWALEGTLGSKLKIDPVYLSPNLDIAIKLGEITNEFQTAIMISEDLFKICSQKTQLQLRETGRVAISEEKEIGVYTCDLDLSKVSLLEPDIQDPEKSKTFNRIAREKLKELSKSGEYHVSKLWEEDNDLKNMKSI
ncbi:unnamed protein product [Blepharisma stoltei]|uniref:Ion transport domain-containing protein n=1 Tax=Blepharisma stoltei TaxID=1481888 RepID=A0AAU9IRY6_9CILI|nr:unnamed protein product [Blepharisma stoltei]